MAVEQNLPQYWDPASPTPPKPNSKLSDEQQLGISDVINGPTFTLRADDPLAPAIIQLWANLSQFNKDVSPARLAYARKLVLTMEQWQKDRGIAP